MNNKNNTSNMLSTALVTRQFIEYKLLTEGESIYTKEDSSAYYLAQTIE